jgi:hypothetical protein
MFYETWLQMTQSESFPINQRLTTGTIPPFTCRSGLEQFCRSSSSTPSSSRWLMGASRPQIVSGSSCSALSARSARLGRRVDGWSSPRANRPCADVGLLRPQAEAQPLLFRRFTTTSPSQHTRLLLRALQSSTHLRSYVHSVTFERTSFEATDDLLRNLRLVPNLAHVAGLVWPFDPLLSPPDSDVRPALQHLSLDVDAAAAGVSSLAAWFRLDGLQSLTTYAADEPFTNLSFLADIPSDVPSLAFVFFCTSIYPDLMAELARRQDLVQLELQPAEGTFVTAQNPLALLPGLQRLQVRSVEDPTSFLAVKHANITHLGLSVAFETWATEMPPSHQLRSFVHDLCGLIISEPTHFPKLVSVQLLAEDTYVSFEDGYRFTSGAAGLARNLRRSGLCVLDEDGIEWQDDWAEESGAEDGSSSKGESDDSSSD